MPAICACRTQRGSACACTSLMAKTVRPAGSACGAGRQGVVSVTMRAMRSPAGLVGEQSSRAIMAREWAARERATRKGDRKSGVEGKSVSVRVDPGGRLIIKKKQNIEQHKKKQQ